KQEDLALFFLLLRIKWYLEKEYAGGRQARVFVDEGFKKNGVAIRMPRFARQFADGLVCFARSDTILPIQLADFAAFALNRNQILLSKPGDRASCGISVPGRWLARSPDWSHRSQAPISLSAAPGLRFVGHSESRNPTVSRSAAQ